MYSDQPTEKGLFVAARDLAASFRKRQSLPRDPLFFISLEQVRDPLLQICVLKGVTRRHRNLGLQMPYLFKNVRKDIAALNSFRAMEDV